MNIFYSIAHYRVGYRPTPGDDPADSFDRL
ncbi:hypothetical protein Natoc_3179 [Natronococcus occultus SP4]|uniref:Uncharacterized protein n=1 Tax=Natronococcus occultus SP4 TaxID=694430 RepID=L0K484_9EURY|nr:hypothetical protein Natoc_3179 [Natronococcus occultus SP4]